MSDESVLLWWPSLQPKFDWHNVCLITQYLWQTSESEANCGSRQTSLSDSVRHSTLPSKTFHWQSLSVCQSSANHSIVSTFAREEPNSFDSQSSLPRLICLLASWPVGLLVIVIEQDVFIGENAHTLSILITTQSRVYRYRFHLEIPHCGQVEKELC